MLSKTFIKKITKQLQQEKQEILARSNQKIDVDVDGDETDEIQANILLGVQKQLNNRDNLKLIQINEALMKINNDNYGLCQDCEENIPEKRLSINPYFTLCIGCAEDRETEFKQRKRI